MNCCGGVLTAPDPDPEVLAVVAWDVFQADLCPEQGLKATRMLVELVPGDPWYRGFLAVELHRSGLDTEALAAIEFVLAGDPEGDDLRTWMVELKETIQGAGADR